MGSDWLAVALLLTGCDPIPIGTRPREGLERADFDVTNIELSVVDVGMTREIARFADREPVPALVINGGFFDREKRPVGLVIAGGDELSPLDVRLGGGVLWIRDGIARLSEAETYAEREVDFAIQGKPRLVVGGKTNIGGGDNSRAARTALCIRDGGRRLEVTVWTFESGGVTLAELAGDMAAAGCEAALNLDGGPSSGWARQNGEGRPPDAPIRHAIVFRRR